VPHVRCLYPMVEGAFVGLKREEGGGRSERVTDRKRRGREFFWVLCKNTNVDFKMLISIDTSSGLLWYPAHSFVGFPFRFLGARMKGCLKYSSGSRRKNV